MNNKEYYISILNHNNIQLIANGHTKDQVDVKLKDSLRLLYISADMFNQNQSESGPAYFLRLAQEALDSGVQQEKYKIYNLSFMGDLIDRKRKISELINPKVTSDNLRGWSCLWELANNNLTGILGDVPTLEEQRWLVTDTGFLITKSNPYQNPPNSDDELVSSINEFINQFNVAFKYGAPNKVLQLFAEIIKKESSSYYESKGSYSHLTVEDLEVMLERRISVENANLAMGTNFVVRGLNSNELRRIILERKSDGFIGNNDGFKFGDILKKYINGIHNN